MYNYETPPPAGVWESIAAELGNGGAKIIPVAKQNNKRFLTLFRCSCCYSFKNYGINLIYKSWNLL